MGPGKVKKVDMVINLSNRKSPDILIECKKANQNLTENNLSRTPIFSITQRAFGKTLIAAPNSPNFSFFSKI